MGHSRAGLDALHVAGVPQSPWHPQSYLVPASPVQPDTRPSGHISHLPTPSHTHQALPVSMTFANAGLSAWLTLFTRKRSNCSLKAQLKCPLFCKPSLPTQPPKEVPSGSCSTYPSFSPPVALFCLSGPLDGQGSPWAPLPHSRSGTGQVLTKSA